MTNPFIKTERSWFLAIFGLPFFLIGVGMFTMSILPTLYDGWRMQSWSATEAHLLHAELITSSSSDTTTYRAEARYQYTVNSTDYVNNRVTHSTSSDNVGDFQQSLGRRLEHHYRAGQTVRIWFDPSNPEDAIISRDIRWGLFGLKGIFVLLFGGVGFGLIYFGLRGRKVNTSPEVVDKPWLKNPDWKDGQVRSGAKTGMKFIWFFALFWNLVSAPLLFQLTDIWQEKGAVVLIALLFPLIGLGLLGWAIKMTLEWRKFGRTQMNMDPFPGSIGGDVAGEIFLNMRHDPAQVYEVTLSCLYSYISGSGKNRSRHEKVIWQDSGYARSAMDMVGAKLAFRFQVPAGLQETDEKEENEYHLWRLNLHAEMDGVDLDRDFEIPVYATKETARKISVLSAKEQPVGIKPQTIESILPISKKGRHLQVHYPMFRKPLQSVGLLLFGAIFGGVSLFLWGQAEKEGIMLYFMASIFSLVSVGILFGGAYMLLNSLLVTLDGQRLTSRRSILGIPVSNKNIHYDDVLSVISKKGSTTQNGKKHVINYRIVATHSGGEITLAEQLTSHSRANQAIEYFKARLRE
jgi:hypothetical protein